jgi:putative endonuclease
MRGELVAERVLLMKGYRILARRWSCRYGEVDLIAMDGDEVVFVEVKARTDATFGRPEDAVGYRKRVRLRRAAYTYLARRGLLGSRFRIDVIAVLLGERSARVRHLVAAVGEEG